MLKEGVWAEKVYHVGSQMCTKKNISEMVKMKTNIKYVSSERKFILVLAKVEAMCYGAYRTHAKYSRQ